jgi:hypothetical protein
MIRIRSVDQPLENGLLQTAAIGSQWFRLGRTLVGASVDFQLAHVFPCAIDVTPLSTRRVSSERSNFFPQRGSHAANGPVTGKTGRYCAAE